MMKIITKDKNDKTLRSLYDKRDIINNISRNQEMGFVDILICIFFVSSFCFVLFALKYESFNIMQNIVILIGFAAPFSILKTKYFSKKKQLKNISKKIDEKISKFEKSNKHLNISENYQIFYNELMILRGNKKLEKINPILVQEIIEEYRNKDKLSLYGITNEERLNNFTDNEINNTRRISQKEYNSLEIQNH